MEKDSNVRSVERALDILNCFGQNQMELTLTEISREIGLARSTTLRILSTLEKKEFLARNEETQKYSLGFKMAQLGMLCFSNMDFRNIAKPYMVRLRDYYNESVSLYITQGNYRVCVERVESTQPLRRVINVGDRLTLTRGASGRVLLAYMGKEKIREILAQDGYTTEEELIKLREQGYTVSRGEREEGVTSIAAPVFNAKNKMISALSISGPTVRFSEEELPERIKKIKEFAEKISYDLGYQR